MGRWARLVGALAVVVVLAVAGVAAIGLVHTQVLSRFTHDAPTPSPGLPIASPKPPLSDFPPAPADAASLLARLTVEPGRNWRTYDRERFGFWNDDTDGVGGHNGCDTRSDLLIRDLDELRVGDRNPCVVLSGVLRDPFTGADLPYRYRTASRIESDHLVALGAAWRGGAWAWTDAERNTYFNDLDVLLAVDKDANQDKGSKTPDKWMPPRAEFHCEYASRWVGVKAKYALTVTKQEKAALAGVLKRCG